MVLEGLRDPCWSARTRGGTMALVTLILETKLSLRSQTTGLRSFPSCSAPTGVQSKSTRPAILLLSGCLDFLAHTSTLLLRLLRDYLTFTLAGLLRPLLLRRPFPTCVGGSFSTDGFEQGPCFGFGV